MSVSDTAPITRKEYEELVRRIEELERLLLPDTDPQIPQSEVLQ
jgi:hypothetical protein